MQGPMTAIGDEVLSMDKGNFGIKMEFSNMRGSGNVESHTGKEKCTINGEILNLKDNLIKEGPKEGNIGQTLSMFVEIELIKD